MMFNITCLVNRNAEGRFEQAVSDLANRFEESYVIEMNGPWPPYSFVNLAL
jgi:hypothetical protein